MSGSKHPLTEACREVLSDNELAALAAEPAEDQLGFAFTLLLENGIDDPEAFLRAKGILE